MPYSTVQCTFTAAGGNATPNNQSSNRFSKNAEGAHSSAQAASDFPQSRARPQTGRVRNHCRLPLSLLADSHGASPDRDELEEAIEEGFRDFENGDHIGAREFLAQLRARNA